MSMTKGELWLKLFKENETALACAIHFCERFVTMEQFQSGSDFIVNKIRELHEPVPDELVKSVFVDNSHILKQPTIDDYPNAWDPGGTL